MLLNKFLVVGAMLLLSACSSVPEGSLCLDAQEQEALEQQMLLLLDKAYQRGFKAGVKHERDTI